MIYVQLKNLVQPPLSIFFSMVVHMYCSFCKQNIRLVTHEFTTTHSQILYMNFAVIQIIFSQHSQLQHLDLSLPSYITICPDISSKTTAWIELKFSESIPQYLQLCTCQLYNQHLPSLCTIHPISQLSFPDISFLNYWMDLLKIFRN